MKPTRSAPALAAASSRIPTPTQGPSPLPARPAYPKQRRPSSAASWLRVRPAGGEGAGAGPGKPPARGRARASPSAVGGGAEGAAGPRGGGGRRGEPRERELRPAPQQNRANPEPRQQVCVCSQAAAAGLPPPRCPGPVAGAGGQGLQGTSVALVASFNMTNPQPAIEGGISEVEIISQQVDEETKSLAHVQLGNFAYRDLPLAAVDLSTEGSQLLSNLDEDYQREGSNWLKPCCGKRAAVWQVFLLSASLNSFLVACVILVVILLTLELLIDIKLLQFSSAFQFAGVIHWISLVILSVFFSETVLRIVVLGIWDYIENKIEVFDGAVIILSLAPMVASTVANGPRSPWDAISLIIMLRIWRVKRVIDAYVLPVKVEMEMVIQQYEKAKVIQDEQLERLTQICQEQGFEIRQLRAHLAQQDLDLAAEREAALQAPHVLSQPRSRYKVVEDGAWDEETAAESFVEELQPSQDAAVRDDMNSYISQYYNGPSSDSGVPEPAVCLVTTAAIDIHQPNISSDLFSVDMPPKLDSNGAGTSTTSETTSHSTHSSVPRAHSDNNSQTLASTTDCSTTHQERASEPGPSPQQQPMEASVQDLLSSLSEDPCPSQRALDLVPPAQPSPEGSAQSSPELEHRVSLFNQKNQEGFTVFQIKPVIHFQPAASALEEKFRSLESKEQKLHRVPEA
ncbi:PREDICTED: transmembrane protein C15orf27 homolog [Chrysochloris asiatica]|uniref:Transmembrane protein 266 n=1 Tax=Chrysochloris asiatica TaxID=185453 RepID=A0A9B0TMJ4_CHRAS|nr:PREDICTED: transmembrane protein C15orf27 homolog [Chrysochloris asiatica]